jgi:PAS domain S-box-containing protein
MKQIASCWGTTLGWLRGRRCTADLGILVLLLVLCTLFYYFGELVDFAGWTNLRWSFFYTVHDLHRLLFLPAIIYAAYSFKVRGAIIVTVITLVLILPRALFISAFPDPIARLVVFMVFALAVGLLTGMVRNQAEKSQRIYQQQQDIYRQLQQSEERYRQLFENAYDAIWVHDMDGNIISANEAATKFNGFKVEDLSHTRVRSSLGEESLRLANEVRTRLLRGEPVAQPYEQRVIARNGGVAVLKLTTSVVRVDGKPVGFQHIARDVTQELKEAERRGYLEKLVKEDRDRFFGILERMKDGVFIVGSDYKIRFMNPTMVSEFGKGIGAPCYEHLHGFDSPCDQLCKLPLVLKGTTERWEYTFSDGRTYEVVASPFVDFDGMACQLATLRNITQRKQVEAELIKLNQLKSDLLSNVSHELRSPLTSIKGIISSLLQKDVEWDSETREMLLNGINEEADRLASLVTNLLNMSKLEAGVWVPEKERCHISDIIRDALANQKWIHKKHVFEANIEPVLPEVYVDRNQIRQVLVNLLENAAAYSQENTKITVLARVVDGEVEVSVSDQGVGMTLEDLKKIFEKFYRGSQKRQRPGGTGLGLAICQAIIQEHGGRIWAQSEAGRGSTFNFRLPAARPEDK